MAKKKNKRLHIFSIRLGWEYYVALKNEAERKDCSMSFILKEWILVFLLEPKEQRYARQKNKI